MHTLDNTTERPYSLNMTQEETWLLTEKYAGEKCEAFFADCTRLHNGEPLAYLIGSIPFLNTVIFLDSHPLIPRTETEFWVEKILTEIQRHPSPKVLDLCAGSGCIGVAILTHISDAVVHFSEIETHHHATIKKNIAKNAIAESRTHIYGGDLFEQITDMYDYILTNPPYIDPMLDRTEMSVTTYEPHRALYGGKNGFELIEKIISNASKYLTPRGTLVIEHEPEQSELIQACGNQNRFDSVTHVDQYNIERYTILARKA